VLPLGWTALLPAAVGVQPEPRVLPMRTPQRGAAPTAADETRLRARVCESVWRNTQILRQAFVTHQPDEVGELWAGTS
jgi:hypothetical protein